MATITVAQVQLRKNVFGLGNLTKGGAEHPGIKEGASQTFSAGQPVMLSSGLYVLATASSNLIAAIAGFALAAASGVTNNPFRYRPMMPGDQYVGNVKGHSGTVVTAQAQVGTHYNLDISSGNLVVDLDNSFDATKLYCKVNDLFTVAAGYPEGDALGDTTGRVVFTIPDQLALQY